MEENEEQRDESGGKKKHPPARLERALKKTFGINMKAAYREEYDTTEDFDIYLGDKVWHKLDHTPMIVIREGIDSEADEEGRIRRQCYCRYKDQMGEFIEGDFYYCELMTFMDEEQPGVIGSSYPRLEGLVIRPALPEICLDSLMLLLRIHPKCLTPACGTTPGCGKSLQLLLLF